MAEVVSIKNEEVNFLQMLSTDVVYGYFLQ